MRNLKKVLALCVALTMAFGLMISAAAFTDDASITNSDAVTMLTQLKIISGYPDGSFKPAGTVTRAEMAKMVYVALRKGTDDKGVAFVNANVPIADINGHWAQGYVKFAFGAGIIAGFPDGSFQPDAKVTGYQAAKMLLTALGYKSEIQGYTGAGWDYRIAVDAASAGLLEDIEDVDLSLPLNRDNAAQMIYNAIFAKMVIYDDGVLTEQATFAETKMGLIKIEGTLLANDQAGIVKVADDGKYKIWGDYNGDGKVDDDDEPLEIEGSADISLIGQDVSAYIKVNDGVTSDDIKSDDVVKTYGKVFATPGENTVVVDYSGAVNDDNDTDKYTALFKNYGTYEENVVYTEDETAFVDYNGNGKQDEGLNEVADNKDYNGDGDKLDDDLDEPDYAPTKGDKSIYIDNDDDGVYDIVIELEMTYDSGIDIDSSDKTIDGAIFDDEDLANVIGADAIKDGDAVVAYPINDCSSDYAGGVYKCTTVEGTLKGTRGGTDVKVDSTYYTMSGIVDDLFNDITNDNNFGETITLTLDLGGYVVDYDTTADDVPNKYCGVREVQWATGGSFGKDPKVAVTLEDGTDAVYVVKAVGDGMPDITDDIDEEDQDPGYFVGSVFAYSLNSDNKITLKTKVADLETAGADYNTALLSKDYGTGDSTIKLAGDHAGTYTVRSSSVFFNYNGKDDFDVYVGKTKAPDIKTKTIDGEEVVPTVSVYDNGDYSTKTASVVLSSDTFTTTTDTGNYALVLNVDVTYSDGDYNLEITALSGSKIITINGDDGIGFDGSGKKSLIKEGQVIEYTMDGDVASAITARDINANFEADDHTGDNDQVFYGGFAIDYNTDDGYITLRNGAATDDSGDATFALADDAVVSEIDDLDATTVKTSDVDPTTTSKHIKNDFASTEANVIVEFDLSDNEVVAIYYLNDDTVTVK